MNFINKHKPITLLGISLLMAAFLVYPNIACLPWELSFLDTKGQTSHLLFFFYRYAYFTLSTWLLLIVNIHQMQSFKFLKRLALSVAVTVLSYGIYVGLSTLVVNAGLFSHTDCFGSILLFQFFVMLLLCVSYGFIINMQMEHNRKEHEIERLKTENLQSKCDALANQINPHFFFNSLNGIAALVRKHEEETTLEYVNKLSDIFRYILQSDKRGLVSLSEELESLNAFKYLMEVRFANKLVFNVNVDNIYLEHTLPALSLIPLIDNIVVHNTIDSQNVMNIEVYVDDNDCLTVTNPIYPKLTKPDTNGTGLKNLESRYRLLMNKSIIIDKNNSLFKVTLPLAK